MWAYQDLSEQPKQDVCLHCPLVSLIQHYDLHAGLLSIAQQASQ